VNGPDDKGVMPADPDFDDVPAELLALDGQQLTLLDADGVSTGVCLIVPGVFGAARRAAQHDDTDEEGT